MADLQLFVFFFWLASQALRLKNVLAMRCAHLLEGAVPALHCVGHTSVLSLQGSGPVANLPGTLHAAAAERPSRSGHSACVRGHSPYGLMSLSFLAPCACALNFVPECQSCAGFMLARNNVQELKVLIQRHARHQHFLVMSCQYAPRCVQSLWHRVLATAAWALGTVGLYFLRH